MEPATRIRVAAFDLDGTLLRGDTVCQVIARRLGHLASTNEIERLRDRAAIASARHELAGYYRPVSPDRLRAFLDDCTLAPGARQGLTLLKSRGSALVIVSITWSVAVEHFTGRLGADHGVGTVLNHDGEIEHCWPDDKPQWLASLMRQMHLTSTQVAAVGDSPGDAGMLNLRPHAFIVGRALPSGLAAAHRPEGDILAIAREIVAIR